MSVNDLLLALKTTTVKYFFIEDETALFKKCFI